MVEDHPRLTDTIAAVLRREGIAVDVAFDGREALDRAALTDYDVVVLDRDLPVVHGDDVCRSLVASGQGAVLMLTAAATVDDRVEGLGFRPREGGGLHVMVRFPGAPAGSGEALPGAASTEPTPLAQVAA